MITTLAVTASLMLSGAPAHAATKPLTFRGMTIQIPSSWKVKDTGGGTFHVLTGGCPSRAVECKGFWLHGPQGIKYAYEGGKYDPKLPYHPSSGVMECVQDKRYWSSPLPAKPTVTGVRKVGAGHKAYYRVWKISCSKQTGGATSVSYPQKLWYLPSSKILVVDQWQTPGLSTALKHATWK